MALSGADREPRRVVAASTRLVEAAGADGGRSRRRLAVEAPLEIRVNGRPLAVTLRTPGNDHELVLGFLLAEGVVEAVAEVTSCVLASAPDDSTRRDFAPPSAPSTGEGEAGAETAAASGGTLAHVELAEAALERWARRRVEREFRSTSACGACGKPSLEELFVAPRRAGGVEPAGSTGPPLGGAGWADLVRRRQSVFLETGGVHGAAALDPGGRCVGVYEDVGRHNALDKLVGAALLGRLEAVSGERPRGRDGAVLDGLVVLSTGRAGFEIVQKALRARAAALLTLGAATTLAVELAREGGLPLVTFAAGEAVVFD